MLQKAIVDVDSSDSDDNHVSPSPQSVRQSTHIQTLESPWSQWPSEKIVAILEEVDIMVSNDCSRNDLILLASNTLGTLAAQPTEDTPAIHPLTPKPTGRKKTAESSPPVQAKSPKSSVPMSPPSPNHGVEGFNAQLLKANQASP